MQNQFYFFRFLLIIPFFTFFQSCQPEEEPFPVVPGQPVEIVFEEGITGIWYGLEYFIEYFDEDGELLHKENEKVFIDNITLDGETITFDYVNSSPDWTNAYTTKTVDGKNYIMFPGFPEIHVTELTIKSMIWEETTEGGTFDDNYGNIQIQADHQVRTFKYRK